MLWNTIIEQNPWWKGRSFISDDRDIQEYERALIKIMRKPCLPLPGSAILIKGPRRVGKTTLLKVVISELLAKERPPSSLLYLNLDTLPSRRTKELAQSLDRFLFDLGNSEGHIFLDEITSIEGWDTLLKGYFDRGAFQKVAVLCTGSDPEKIETGTRTLLGRNSQLYYCAPLAFRSFLLNVLTLPNSSFWGLRDQERTELLSRLKGTTLDLVQPPEGMLSQQQKLEPFSSTLRFLFEKIFLKTGGFPKTINSFFGQLKQSSLGNVQEVKIESSLYQEIIDKILEKAGNTELTKRLLAALSRKEYLSSLLSYHALAKALQVHPATVESYLQKLEALLILRKIGNVEGVLKKVYFTDPFVFNSIYVLDKELNPNRVIQDFLNEESNLGKVVEGMAANALYTHAYLPGLRENFLSFYRKGSKELDFLYFNRLGIEVKYRAELEAPCRVEGIGDYLLLTREPAIKPLNEGVAALPLALFLSLVEEGERWI